LGQQKRKQWVITEWPVLRGERVLDDFVSYAKSVAKMAPSSTSSSSSSSTSPATHGVGSGDRRDQAAGVLATRLEFIEFNLLIRICVPF
jgi:hypothetical protein